MSDIAVQTSTTTSAEPHFRRSLGLLSAVAVNMTQMCGIGPFVTIPLVVAAMGGPQAMLGWVVGAALAMSDGLVWAELGAAMPGAGGTYLYFREAFQYRTGKLMPFLFVWTAMIFIPLIMSTGIIGLIKYLSYFIVQLRASGHRVPNLIKSAPGGGAIAKMIAVTPAGALVALVLMLLVTIALYRNISSIKKLTVALWSIMIISVAGVILACFTHFHASLAFTFPDGAFHMNRAFFAGLGSALVFAVYDYLGYNTTAYMAAELRDPGRVVPRSILLSIVGMMVIYLVMNVGILGVLPWREVVNHQDYLGSEVLEMTWGKTAAVVFTGLIVITAFASVFTGLLGGSRVPFNAARDKLFLPIFGRLHPRLNFPHVAVLVMCIITAIGSLFDLGTIINMLTAVMVLVQCVGQVIALTTLRRRQPNLKRPYRMILYPLPSVIALLGWIYMYFVAGWQDLLKSASSGTLSMRDVLTAPGPLSIIWLALGIAAFMVWASVEQMWPFGPLEIREEFIESGAAVS